MVALFTSVDCRWLRLADAAAEAPALRCWACQRGASRASTEKLPEVLAEMAGLSEHLRSVRAAIEHQNAQHIAGRATDTMDKICRWL